MKIIRRRVSLLLAVVIFTQSLLAGDVSTPDFPNSFNGTTPGVGENVEHYSFDLGGDGGDGGDIIGGAPSDASGMGTGGSGLGGDGGGGDSRGGGGPSSHGMGPGVDIAAMRRHARAMERAEERRQEIEKYQGSATEFYKTLFAVHNSPFILRDIPLSAVRLTTEAETFFDRKDEKALNEKGETLLLPDFLGWRTVIDTMRKHGFVVDPNSLYDKGDSKFQIPWIIQAIQGLEDGMLNERVRKGVETTQAWAAKVQRGIQQLPDSSTFTPLMNSFPLTNASSSSEWPRAQIQSPNSQHATALRELNNKLESSNPATPQGRLAKYIGLQAVHEADEASRHGDESSYQSFFSIGETMADIALGFVPVVGSAKDLWEAITGQSILTGRTLTSEERVLAASSFLLGGLGKLVGKAALPVAKIVSNRAKKMAQAMEKVSINLRRGPIGEKVPHWGTKVADIIQGQAYAGMKANRVLPGNGDKIVVIGRHQDSIKIYAEQLEASLKAQGIKTPVKTFADALSKKADDELQEIARNLPNGHISASRIMSTKLFQENKEWIKKVKAEGHTVIDLGNPQGLGNFSPFYAMEKKSLGLYK